MYFEISIPRAYRDAGFTMIELLMVIVVVSILGAVALPNFLDFRLEGRIASLQHFLATIRTSIKLQRMNILLKCGANKWPDASAVESNTIEYESECSPTELSAISLDQRKFVDDFPQSLNYPYFPSNLVDTSRSDAEIHVTNCVDRATCNECKYDGSDDDYGWCYNTTTGDFWLADPDHWIH